MNVLPPNADRAALYETMSPQASKFLMANGSIIDGAMAVILPPDPERAAVYESMSPQAAKFIMPDGSVTTEGGGGFGGGGTVMWFATIGERDAYFTANPDRLRQGVSVGVGNPVTAYTYDGAAWVIGALAFKGDAGPMGPPGADGVNGIDGQDGQDGNDGADGQDGAPGVGVPTGGTTGQVLKKASDNDFDTEWAAETGGGAFYTHTQTTPSDIWNIQHNLGRQYVNAITADSDGIRMVGWINDVSVTQFCTVYRFPDERLQIV